MRENAITLQDDSFNAGGKKFVNIEYDSDANDAVNAGQFGAHVNYITNELYTLHEAIENAIILREGLYDAGGKKIINVNSCTSDNDFVNVRELKDLRRFRERELNKLRRRSTEGDVDSVRTDEKEGPSIVGD